MANNENVRVVVRCRPMNSKENQMKCKPIVDIHDCTVNLINPNDVTAPAKSFVFDNVYSEHAPTEAIYNDICYSLVESVLEGYNATIFAYGQTGCGKSHTMQGPVELFGTTEKNDKILAQRGIISRSFEHIFEEIFVSSDTRYLAFVSFLEIYNENIRDLLCPENTNLQLKEVPGEGVTVKNLSSHTVHNSGECENLLLYGAKHRIVGSTDMNAGSSRSHSIFTINLEQISTDRDAVNLIKKGKLNLVDLAGSERQNKTGATGDRLKEATKINLSLSALGNVISALVDGKTKHIPYRDAKLTRLLQDSLGGNTKTLMISCVSPADYNYDETLSTLRYASRAKSIHNKPKINEDPKDTIIREYQQEITKLKNLLEKAQLLDNFETNIIKSEHIMEIKQADELKKLNEILIPISQQTDQEVCIRIPKRPVNMVDDVTNTIIEKSTTIVSPVVKPMIISPTITASQNVNNNSSLITRLQTIKNSMIGGEKSNDVQLKEKRNKKKLAAQKRISELAHALDRIEQEEDRDILQGHYTNIQHELQFKTATLKKQRQQVRALEREVIDIQSEFQLDRADYLETIRRLEKHIKFYQQLMECALPMLRKNGRLWDIDVIKSESEWNDDLQKWKIPEEILIRKKLPPAANSILNEKYNYNVNSSENSGRKSTSLTAPGRLENSLNFTGDEYNNNLNGFHLTSLMSSNENLNSSKSFCGDYLENNSDSGNSIDSGHNNDFIMKKNDNIDNVSIVESYFRPRRANELLQQTRNNSIAYSSKLYSHVPNYLNDANNYYQFRSASNLNNYKALNKTWNGAETSRNSD